MYHIAAFQIFYPNKISEQACMGDIADYKIFYQNIEAVMVQGLVSRS